MSKAIQTSGKRKKSIARATLRAGKGKIRVNSVMLDVYEPKMARLKISEPLQLSGKVSKEVDIDVNVSGGGTMSQADAARLAVAKALVEYTQDDSMEKAFLDYDRNLLVADVRQRESRKPNTHGNARGKTQKSYR